MKFTVLNHPTLAVIGVTTVSDEHILEDGTKPVVDMGQLTKKRGEDGYRASFLDNGDLTKIKGLFSSRSQAGHAVRAKFEKELRSEKATARKNAPATTSTKPAVDTDQAKRDARNARRREQRAAAKAAA